MSGIFSRRALKVIDGIYDYLEGSDDYVENYDQIAADDMQKHLMPDEVKEVLLNCCELLAPTSDLVVDVGAAYGFILSRLTSKRKVAVDIALEYLKHIDGSTTRVRANAEQLPFVSDIADTVVCTDVFEHVRNESSLSRELSRILRPGGQLLLATPWEQDLSVYETAEYKARYAKYKYVHLRSVTYDLISRCFPDLELRATTLITIGMKHMTLKPYPIRFLQLVKGR